MATRLGLDLGTNSIGWCLLDLDGEGNPAAILKTGVRIFSDGRDPKSLASLKATRRAARSARRRRDRFIQRQKHLISTLVKYGFMPKDAAERQSLAFKDPYPIRKQALDAKTDPFDMGRAFFHLNQRRGFKSNRKSADNEAGVVKQSVADLELKLIDAKARTIGEFLADRLSKRETVRARRLGQKTSDLYELYPNRAMLEKEFDTLWEKQKPFRPDLYTSAAHGAIKDAIFFQRPLKPQEVGKCSFLPDEDRIAKALPSFQRFRIYQELSHLAWIDRDGKAHPINESLELRDRLFDELEQKRKLTFKSMRTILKKQGIVDYAPEFNLESELRDHLVGNEISCTMRNAKIMGARWDELSEIEQDALVALLLDDEQEDEQVRDVLINTYGFDAADDDKVEACLDARLPAGHGSLSKAAIDKILPVLRDQGLNYYEAVKEAGLGEHNLYDPNAPLHDKLGYYGKALTGHVIGGSGEDGDSDEKRYGTITNPSVHIALNQVRAVINELIDRFGKPDEIALEIGRDLPLGAEGKRDLQRFQREGLDKNNRAREEILKHGLQDSRENRQKFQLWEQLAKDPTERCCPFTGKVIPIAKLFSADVEIEHLLPFSDTLDDSMANKTVCFREANREKGKRSPYDAFGHSPEGYDWQAILERTKNLPKSKKWRFLPDAMTQYEAEGGFLERQLNDTRYISRYTRKYLATIVPENKIWVVTGRLTALLRGHWGLNSILSGHNSEDDKPAKKSRDDHRHHAVDAVVVAMTSRGMLQSVSRAARRSEELDIARLFDDRIDPWDGFRDAVKEHIDAIIVSHRARKKDQGQLHNDTAYGLIDHQPKGASQVVHKVPVESFSKEDDIEKIRDNIIRNALLNATAGLSGKDFEEAVRNWCHQHNIRSLRICETLSVIPIKDKNGVAYKAYKGDANAYMEIYAEPKTGKWQSEIISTFNANTPGFIPQWRKAHPAAKMLMRLRSDDLILFKDTGEICRVQKMSGKRITLAPHNEANVDARDRDKDDPFNLSTVTAAPILQKRDGVKLHISPTGRLSEGR